MRKFLVVALVALSCLLAGRAQANPFPGYTPGCAVRVWVYGLEYDGVVTRSINTSCPFARRVAAQSLRFIVIHGGRGDGDFFVTVWSPVTYRWYRMHCYANGDLHYNMHVDCRGGINARVIYNAHT